MSLKLRKRHVTALDRITEKNAEERPGSLKRKSISELDNDDFDLNCNQLQLATSESKVTFNGTVTGQISTLLDQRKQVWSSQDSSLSSPGTVNSPSIATKSFYGSTSSIQRRKCRTSSAKTDNTENASISRSSERNNKRQKVAKLEKSKKQNKALPHRKKKQVLSKNENKSHSFLKRLTDSAKKNIGNGSTADVSAISNHLPEINQGASVSPNDKSVALNDNALDCDTAWTAPVLSEKGQSEKCGCSSKFQLNLNGEDPITPPEDNSNDCATEMLENKVEMFSPKSDGKSSSQNALDKIIESICSDSTDDNAVPVKNSRKQTINDSEQGPITNHKVSELFTPEIQLERKTKLKENITEVIDKICDDVVSSVQNSVTTSSETAKASSSNSSHRFPKHSSPVSSESKETGASYETNVSNGDNHSQTNIMELKLTDETCTSPSTQLTNTKKSLGSSTMSPNSSRIGLSVSSTQSPPSSAPKGLLKYFQISPKVPRNEKGQTRLSRDMSSISSNQSSNKESSSKTELHENSGDLSGSPLDSQKNYRPSKSSPCCRLVKVLDCHSSNPFRQRNKAENLFIRDMAKRNVFFMGPMIWIPYFQG